MMALEIPEAGLRLQRPSSLAANTTAHPPAFALNLNNAVIEEMIECFKKGKEIQLCLGDNPVSRPFLYAVVVRTRPFLPLLDLFSCVS